MVGVSCCHFPVVASPSFRLAGRPVAWFCKTAHWQVHVGLTDTGGDVAGALGDDSTGFKIVDLVDEAAAWVNASPHVCR